MPKMQVLICDDNPAIHKSLASYFEAENMEVLSASTGEQALACCREREPDLLVLDVMLPDISGLDVCRQLRKTKNTPILMLSAKGEEVDRIVGLEIGADDYVIKPFSPREVVVRGKKLLQRYSSTEQEKRFTLAELTVFPDSYEAFVGEQRVHLTTREFEALLYLVSHAGKAVTREHIINAVWGSEYIGEPRIVDTLIKRLRQKLISSEGPAVHFNIATIYGVGYKAQVLE